ncbi:MAG: NAD(P)/FAD-dependent oxidoreductase [Salinivirgaceae bacterium]
MKLQQNYSYLIVGAGIAGLSAIKTIRQTDTQSSILLISNEDRLPYKRTKINKSMAAGFSKDEFMLNPEDWYKAQHVDLAFEEVLKINTAENEVVLADGQIIRYNKLLLAPGATPVYPVIDGISDSDLLNVHFAKNVEHIRNMLANKNEVLIIGGSVEGLETANQLIKMGKKVVVIDRLKDPLGKLFPDYLTKKIYADMHQAGVVYLPGFTLNKLVKTDDKRYKMDTPEYKTTFDALLVCAGVRPNIRLAEHTGIATDRGILVNEYMQTSISNIFAAGDVAQHPDGLVTGLWHPAEYQGYCAGENMLAVGSAYHPVPLRLKTTLFGNFYFSANYHLSHSYRLDVSAEELNGVFREFYVLDAKVLGMVMMNDKERAKTYQQAVAEQWPLEKVKEQLPL